jgi:hypothetical protein
MPEELANDIKRSGLVLLLLGLFCNPAVTQAQTTGNCEPGEATVDLDVNNVRARLYNTGNLFWRGAGNVYNVPKSPEGEPINPNAIFVTALWMGGMVDDELRMAAAAYGNWEFWPGPLNQGGELPNPDDCSAYDRIYTVYRTDIERYNQTGEAATDLIEWPWRLGAPVLNGDGNPNNYALEAGDRPALVGDQMAWWVMNDVGNGHGTTDTPPMQMEVQVSAFSFNLAGALGNTTFYRYKLHYKGQEPLEDTWFGFFSDADVGNATDDYAGTDTTLRMVYAYNVDDFDEGVNGYGAAPPAVGFSLLQGPLGETDGRDNDRDGEVDESGERLRMTRSLKFYGGVDVSGNPRRGTMDFYNYLRGRWQDGTQMCFGGIGHYNLSSSPCSGIAHFMLPGDPITGAYWSMFNIDGQGSRIGSGDLGDFVFSTGPFRMEPGQEEEIVLAIVWSRGDDHLDSIRQLRTDMKIVQNVYPSISMPDSTLTQRPPPELPESLAYAENYPNPFTAATTFHYELPKTAQVTLRVYDMLGREVTTLVDRKQEPGFYDVPFDGSALSPGVYLYRLQVGVAQTAGLMVRVE